MTTTTTTTNGRTPVAAAAPEIAVSIPRMDLQRFELTLIGDTPLIANQWSEKAKRKMREKQQQDPQKGREKRDPDAEYEAATYYFPDGETFGFPSVAFKASAVAACRFVAGLAMTEARGAFHVEGELVKIEGKRSMREDMVRVGMGAADLRYRPMFEGWRTVLPITHNATAMSMAQIVSLFSQAGFGVGVGEWRPSSKATGPYGRYHIAEAGE